MARDKGSRKEEVLEKNRNVDDQRVRNLINQRNFRSRQKTYVAELEQKLRKYEDAEIAATASVQSAARLVAEENQLLRELICTELRWNRETLDRYVSHRVSESEWPNIRSNKSGLTSSRASLQPSTQLPDSSGSTNRPTDVPTNNQHDGKIDRYDYTENDTSSITPTKCHGDTLNEMQLDQSMSCEQAATIISNIRRQDRLDTVREDLGCRSNTTCKVTHNDLFRVMDESI